MEEHLDVAERLVKYIFFTGETNLYKLGKNSDPVRKLTEGRSEKEIVEIMLCRIHSLYEEDMIMAGFLSFVTSHRKGVFLYLSNPEVEKTSDKAEQHFSIQSWLFNHRSRTKEGLLRTSYRYYRY
ncbi:hypothetical protein Thermo_00623 [Thermoplasmatales archaeon]|nr:hypothetical protein Thermo_00623 [Thermoplasmatales archaeon]